MRKLSNFKILRLYYISPCLAPFCPINNYNFFHTVVDKQCIMRENKNRAMISTDGRTIRISNVFDFISQSKIKRRKLINKTENWHARLIRLAEMIINKLNEIWFSQHYLWSKCFNDTDHTVCLNQWWSSINTRMICVRLWAAKMCQIRNLCYQK